jgi:hypothetical protein
MKIINSEPVSSTVWKIQTEYYTRAETSERTLLLKDRQFSSEFYIVIYPAYRNQPWTPNIRSHEEAKWLVDLWQDNRQYFLECFQLAEGIFGKVRDGNNLYTLDNVPDELATYAAVSRIYGLGIHVHTTKSFVLENMPYVYELGPNQDAVPLLPGCNYACVNKRGNNLPTEEESLILTYIGLNFSTGRQSFYSSVHKKIFDIDEYNSTFYLNSGYYSIYSGSTGFTKESGKQGTVQRYEIRNPYSYAHFPFTKRTTSEQLDYNTLNNLAVDKTVVSIIFDRGGLLYTYTGQFEVAYYGPEHFNKGMWSSISRHLTDGGYRDAILLFLKDADLTRASLPIIDAQEIQWMIKHPKQSQTKQEDFEL